MGIGPGGVAGEAHRDGLPAHGDLYVDNVKRKESWLAAHPGDLIRQSETHRYGTRWECVRDGKQIVEASDLGLLMNLLESDYR